MQLEKAINQTEKSYDIVLLSHSDCINNSKAVECAINGGIASQRHVEEVNRQLDVHILYVKFNQNAHQNQYLSAYGTALS